MVIQVCIGSACHIKGSYDVIEQLKKEIKENNLEDQVDLKASFCMGKCSHGVSIKIDDVHTSVLPDELQKFFSEQVLEKL